MKVNFVLFQDSKALKQGQFDNLNTNYLVTWTVLCFHFHTHWSLQHSKTRHYFHKQLLKNCVLLFTVYAPQSPTQIKTMWVCRTCEFSEPKGILSGTEALNLTLIVLVLLIVQGMTIRTARLPEAGNLLGRAGEDLSGLPDRARRYHFFLLTVSYFNSSTRFRVTVTVFALQFCNRNISFLLHHQTDRLQCRSMWLACQCS